MTGRGRLCRIAVAGRDDIPPATNPMPDPTKSRSRVRRLVLLPLLFGLTSFTSTAAQDLPPGTVFRDCPTCPEMVVVPAGTFIMGSPESEEERGDSEGPQHRVTIGTPFAVGVYQVTFADWDACVSDGACGGHRPEDEGWGRGSRPVINVSWEDAQGVRAVVVARDRGAVPAADGGGVGVRGPGGDDDGALLGGERVGSVPVWKWGGRRGPAGIP